METSVVLKFACVNKRILSESLALTVKLQKYKIQSSISGLFSSSDMIEVHFREREVHIYAQKNHPEKPCI